MADDYVCGECGQVSENDYCPICESKMVKIGDFDDMSYEVDDDDDQEDDQMVTMGADDYEFDDDSLPSVA